MALVSISTISKKVSAKQVKFTSLTGLVMTGIALIVLAQNYYKYSGVEDYSVKLSLIYNLIVYGSYALLTPVILKLAERFSLNTGAWYLKFITHLSLGVGLALIHMLFCNLVLYSIDLSSSVIFPRFITKYLTNVIHIHLMVYWAIVLLVTFYKDLYDNKPTDHRKSPTIDRFLIRENGRSFYLDFNQVYWIEANDHYQKLHTAEGYHLIKSSMKRLEETLPAAVFKRAHRSYFVNATHIQAVIKTKGKQELFLELSDGTSLKLGKAYSGNFPR